MWSQEKTTVSKEIAEKQLAHSLNNKVELTYARSDLFEKRKKLMEDWSEFISSQGQKLFLWVASVFNDAVIHAETRLKGIVQNRLFHIAEGAAETLQSRG